MVYCGKAATTDGTGVVAIDRVRAAAAVMGRPDSTVVGVAMAVMAPAAIPAEEAACRGDATPKGGDSERSAETRARAAGSVGPGSDVTAGLLVTSAVAGSTSRVPVPPRVAGVFNNAGWQW